MTRSELRAACASVPTLTLAPLPTIVESLSNLSAILGGGPRLLIKRDDALGFALGGNKVRKLALLGARAQAEGCDTLITAGGLQSNHARVTAATAVRLGMRAVLVLNTEQGRRPVRASANALLDALLGADVIYVPEREERIPAMHEAAKRLAATGRKVFTIPIGGSTPLGSLAYLQALVELLDQIPPPDVIVHATSSGGTQAGLVAACRLLGLPTRVVGIAADGPTAQIQSQVRANVEGIAELLQLNVDLVKRGTPIEIDDRFFGGGYAIPTEASREAIELMARTEAIFLDPVYTGKAMAGLIA
ncbi:MAG TPA: D-cysteine desulfhydrase family protein, partial [Vicinamibacterales bacterium]|nr:D-cysteine desulfhydrase family protein [Vicinamibacterales bacterium]